LNTKFRLEEKFSPNSPLRLAAGHQLPLEPVKLGLTGIAMPIQLMTQRVDFPLSGAERAAAPTPFSNWRRTTAPLPWHQPILNYSR
jgi:hypothetical protein